MSRIWAYEKPVNPYEIEEVTSHDKADILLSQFEESERSPDTGKHPGNGSGGGSDGGEVDNSNDNSVYYQYEGTGKLQIQTQKVQVKTHQILESILEIVRCIQMSQKT